MPSFLEYERDRSWCVLLSDSLTAEDLQRSTDLLALIPPDVLSLYRRFYAYRHPFVAPPEEVAFVLEDFVGQSIPEVLSSSTMTPC